MGCASLQDIFSKVDKSGEGVCVQASTLGSLEALLSFLDSGEKHCSRQADTRAVSYGSGDHC
jgi:translation initiation factor IF-2